MLKKSAQIKDQAPLLGDLSAASWPLKGVRGAAGFYFGQKRAQAGRDGDSVGACLPALGGGEGDRAGLKVHQPHLKAGFPQAASGLVSDFKAGFHPGLVRMGVKHAADHQNFLVRKDRSFADRIPARAPVQHGRGGQPFVQPAHSLDPLQAFQVVQGKVAADRLAVGATQANAPADVGVRFCRGKVVERKAQLVHEAGEVAPGVAVVPAGAFRNRMAADQVRDPAVVRVGPRPFGDGKLQRLLHGFRPVQGVIRPVAGGLRRPLSGRRFVPQPVPGAVLSFVNRGHSRSVTSVSNWSKTPTNKE